mmetsp:Transcript_10109/g.15826  ORF Transcript_10109/g.15826 Transcript_10109/m.15826 type:complete len:138 (-) Transcript_10109:1613-2026(-)
MDTAFWKWSTPCNKLQERTFLTCLEKEGPEMFRYFMLTLQRRRRCWAGLRRKTCRTCAMICGVGKAVIQMAIVLPRRPIKQQHIKQAVGSQSYFGLVHLQEADARSESQMSGRTDLFQTMRLGFARLSDFIAVVINL